MDEIDPTLACSSLVFFVQLMMQTILVWRSYLAPNVMHPHTQSKANHASLIFVVWSSIFLQPFVLTFSRGAHIQVRLGYASSQCLLLKVALSHISRTLNCLNMAFISWVMQTSDSDKHWFEKLSLHQNIWTMSSGMLLTTYLASSHAHGIP